MIDNVYQDESQQRLIETPDLVDDRFFERTKSSVLGVREHSAIILAGERALADRSMDPSQLVDAGFEYDMEEEAYPFLQEWRERWWAEVPFPSEWIEDVVLTSETMADWRTRQRSGEDLPPYVPVRAVDVRHGVAPIGWTVDEQEERWQRLHSGGREHTLLLPPDPTLLEELAIQIVIAWMRLSSGEPGPTPKAPLQAADALAANARAAGLPGCAALFEALALHPERPETADQLRVAQALLEVHQPGPSTTQM